MFWGIEIFVGQGVRNQLERDPKLKSLPGIRKAFEFPTLLIRCFLDDNFSVDRLRKFLGSEATKEWSDLLKQEFSKAERLFAGIDFLMPKEDYLSLYVCLCGGSEWGKGEDGALLYLYIFFSLLTGEITAANVATTGSAPQK
jgi:hypothetical protein